MKTQKPIIYKIRVTGDVLATTNGTRRCTVNARVLTFGREPVYIESTSLPESLLNDSNLLVETVEVIPPGAIVADLKSERVQDGFAAGDVVPELKSERVQDGLTAGDGEGEGDDPDLKSERVGEGLAANTRKRR